MRQLATALRFAAVAIVVAAAAACNSGGDDAPEPTAAPTETTQQRAAAAFAENARAFVEASFTATYDATAAPGADAEISAFTLYKDGSQRIRFDATSVIEGEPAEFILIDAGAVSGFCLREAGELGAVLGVGEADGVCFGNDLTDGGASTITDDLEILEEGLDQARPLPDREIAGTTGRCSIVPDEDGADSEVCVSDEGVLLYYKDDESTFTARTIGDAPTDADFALPYPVQELPGTE